MEEETSSLFLSLPYDIALNVLARVPRRYYRILSCVSKMFNSLVCSSELHKTRSLLGKDSFYVSFEDLGLSSFNRHWFTLTENRCLAKVSIPFPFPHDPYSSALMVGSEIYFVGGFWANPSPTRSMWIFDSLSGKLRQGPSMLVSSNSPAVGLVDEKIYIVGGFCKDGYEEIKAQVFDPKTQTWEIAANPSVKLGGVWMSGVSPSLDRKIYAKFRHNTIVYDTRDGNCEIINLPGDKNHSCKDVCVIDNVLYTYTYSPCLGGLMWYYSKEKEWRPVRGLNLNDYNCWNWNITMVEYNGKLAILWHYYSKREIWCAMIVLRRCGVVEVQGQVEWCNITHCLGRTD